MRYRKKPVEIDAFLVTHPQCHAPPRWLAMAISVGAVYWNGGDAPGYRITTLEGVMLARPGDYIIRGVKGELYPCKPDIFEATYEAVGSPTVSD